MIGSYNPQKRASAGKGITGNLVQLPEVCSVPFFLYLSLSLSLFPFLTTNSLTSPTDKQEAVAEPKDQEEKLRVSKTPKDRENGETIQRRRARDCTRIEAAVVKREAGRTFRGSPMDGPGGQLEPPGHP
ncbi:hypothetical protein M9H77_24449 [Catharanthus roseus]|uniref:Uncharacterized protein n=1 Tax=Catharanthus roseus TaxID=4058 RepID=A0ACC0AWI8_CATRO|nr:hypothetical protein M9H77_24449 [Catharanthus roseus]